MRRLLILLLVLGNLAFSSNPPLFQSNVVITDIGAFVHYGKQATFQARVQPSGQVKEIYLFIQPDGMPVRVERVNLSPDGSVIYSYDLVEKPLRPFARTTYWFRVTTLDGQEVTSAMKWFDYDDDRFQWEELKDDQFEVRWYDRDMAFGQEILNTAQAGLKTAQRYLPSELSSPLRIFVYNSTSDFQTALSLSGQSWMVGHASPELGTILVSIPSSPEEKLELERQVPHEIAHVLQYQMAGANYSRVPTWFLEGTASLAELYPNPDYQNVLADAVQNTALISFDQLCGPFPREASGAFLAYAQSASFTRYLHAQYGTSGLGKLMRQYQDGVGCEEGPRRAFGTGLYDLENGWKQEVLGIDLSSLVLRNLSPYLALLGLLLLIPLLVGLWMRAK